MHTNHIITDKPTIYTFTCASTTINIQKSYSHHHTFKATSLFQALATATLEWAFDKTHSRIISEIVGSGDRDAFVSRVSIKTLSFGTQKSIHVSLH